MAHPVLLRFASVVLLLLVGTALGGPRTETPVVIGVRLATTAVTRTPTIFDFFTASPAGFWTKPVAAPDNISSTFGPRWKGSSNRDDWHRGIDYFGEIGDRISAIAAGTVFQVHTEAGGTMSGGGNVVIIVHPVPASLAGIHPFHTRNITKVYSYYLHLSTIDPAMVVDAAVTVGQRVGAMGQSGDTVFTHLHFETRLEGYCSYQFQFENNRVPSSTSSCNTGFDPHVHPYLFVGDRNIGERRLFTTTGFNATGVIASVRYCADDGKLDIDVIETNYGVLRLGTRAGMSSINTESELDNVSNITGWLHLRPQQLGSAGTEHCYDLGFKTAAVPTFLEIRDIYGSGLRTNDVTGTVTVAVGTTSAAATPTSTVAATASSPGATTGAVPPTPPVPPTTTTTTTTTVPASTTGAPSPPPQQGNPFRSSAARGSFMGTLGVLAAAISLTWGILA